MVSLTIANLKMMARNRQTAFWALFFPLLLVLIFGLVDFDGTGSTTIAIMDKSDSVKSQNLKTALEDIEFLDFQREIDNYDTARRKIENNDLDYFLLIDQGFDETRLQDNLLYGAPVILLHDSENRERNQLVEGVVRSLVSKVDLSDSPNATDSLVQLEEIASKKVSYFDVVLMGILGLGIMTHSIISIAVKISTYRNQAILKRMLVTPLKVWKYFASEITAHLVLSIIQATIIMAVGVFLFGGHIRGNITWIFVIVILGNLVFLNIGFILSAWANTPAAASGMGNAIALPMIFIAGTFFSTSSLPWFLPYLAQAVPLTPMLAALHNVAIDGEELWHIWPHLAALTGWVIATGLFAIRVFRFS
jgi:ABC-2 type transport system permease protein